jgi:Ca2+-transporting ATPase
MTDIFPGLALSLEPAEPGVMQRPPRDPGEPIVSMGGLARMASESAVITTGAMAAYAYGLARYGAGAIPGTLAFNTITLAQLLHALSCRSPGPVLVGGGRLPRNPHLELALGVSFGVQVLANLIPGLRRLLDLAPLRPLDLLAVGAGAALPLLANEALKHAWDRPAVPAGGDAETLH